MLYDAYDLSGTVAAPWRHRGGTVAAPGHYAFLADPNEPASVVVAYEGLRDGTATALLIYTHDAQAFRRRRASTPFNPTTCSNGVRATTASCATR